MTDLRKAAEMALEALVDFGWHIENCPQFPTWAEPKKHPPCTCGYDTTITALRQALEHSSSDSAKHSADLADSFCQQELYNLQSVAGRMALELECLLLDTKDLAVVSRWWDTGMEALQAYRDHIWSITHGKDGEEP